MPRSAAIMAEKPAESSSRPQPLKRSGSCASVTSLPTPPRTRKRKRSHSRATDSDESDPEDHAVPVVDSDDEEIKRNRAEAKGALFLGNKKRKMLQVDAIAAELSGAAAEDAFWGGPSTAALESKKQDPKNNSDAEPLRGRSRSRSPSASPANHLLRRTHTGLLSPPRSRRHKSPVGTLLIRPVAPPVTPARRTGPITRSLHRKLFPERDSPNNPFLVDPEGSPDHTSRPSTSRPRTPVRHVERPKITYVFRGVRAEFDNPLYDPRYPETGMAPPNPESPSNLPVTDPNFSPTPYCPPKLLFPEAHRRQRRTHAPRSDSPIRADAATISKESNDGTGTSSKPHDKRQASRKKPVVPSEWDTSDEEDGGGEAPLKLPGRDTQKVQSPQPSRRDEQNVRRKLDFQAALKEDLVEFKPPQKDRSDPIKRALGPVRKRVTTRIRQ